MGATRARLLTTVADLVAQQGVRGTAMTDIAQSAGVAKATLYNHFRTKDEVLAALVVSQIQHVIDVCAEQPLDHALSHAAQLISANPIVVRMRESEPEILVEALLASDTAPGWQLARQAVVTALHRAGRREDVADIVLRWLSTFLTHPGDGADAELLVASLPPMSELSSMALPN